MTNVVLASVISPCHKAPALVFPEQRLNAKSPSPTEVGEGVLLLL